MSLEKKIVDFENKVDKYVFNIRNLNKVIAILTALFIVFCFVFYIKKNNQLDEQNAVYNRMLDDLVEHQLVVMYSNVTPNSGEIDTTKVPEEPMFTNAKDAALVAFDNFYNYKSYEIIGYGTTTAVAMNQNVVIGIGYKNYKYLNGTEWDENIRKELYTNFGQSDACQIVYKNNKRYERHGENIRQNGEYWIADFYSGFYERPLRAQSHPFYLVNKETIKFSKFFSFTRNKKGLIEYYKATIILDPYNSTTDYAKDIQDQGGTSYPEFSSVELACIIDRNGHLMSYTVTEKMTLSKHIVIDITTTTTNVMTGIIISHDVEPSVPEPII